MLFTTRKEIIEFLMVYLPEYIKNESYYDKLKFLINFYEYQNPMSILFKSKRIYLRSITLSVFKLQESS